MVDGLPSNAIVRPEAIGIEVEVPVAEGQDPIKLRNAVADALFEVYPTVAPVLSGPDRVLVRAVR